MEDVLSIGVLDYGAAGIVSVIIFMILTDRLVTRKRLEEAKDECNYWRKAYENSEAVRFTMIQQQGELLQAARTTTQVITSLPEAVATVRRDNK